MQSLARVISAAKLSGRATTSGSKYASISASKTTKARSLASSSLKRANMKALSARAYCTPSGFAAPAQNSHEQLPKVNQSVRPAGPDGFIRVTPEQLYIDLREGVTGVLVDVRPADEFANWHLLGSHNIPVATSGSMDLEGLALDRPIYIISGGQPKDIAGAVKVAEVFKSKGYYANIIEAGMKSFPDAGFMYYLDADAEDARLAAVAAAKAAAAAAAAKK